MAKLWWVSADKQGEMDMGDYADEQSARDAIPAQKEILLGQCTDDAQRQGIEAGSWHVG